MTDKFQVGDMIVDRDACGIITEIKSAEEKLIIEWNRKQGSFSSEDYLDNRFSLGDVIFLMDMGRWELKKIIKDNSVAEQNTVNKPRKKRNNASKE